MKVHLFIGILLSSLFASVWKLVEFRNELAEINTRSTLCDEKAELADRVILTCLSWQVVVKMELESMQKQIRTINQ